MDRIDWRLEGEWLKNCNCAYGCPCDFNARPTEGFCEGVLGMRVTRGHHDGLALDGLGFFLTMRFPGAVHEGDGEAQLMIDARADARQRAALARIVSGVDSDEGTLFAILNRVITRFHEPLFARFDFAFDADARVARLTIDPVLETAVEPIRNPVTGLPHRVRVEVPEGFEYRSAEIASSWVRSEGAIAFGTHDSHASLAHVVHTPQGMQ